MNLYAYVRNSPLNLTDAFGLSGGGIGLAEPPVDTTAEVIQDVATTAEAGVATTTAITAGEGTGPVMTLIAGGSAEGSTAGPIGALVGIGAAAYGGTLYQSMQTTNAVMNANAADQEVFQAIHNLNQLILAGRYTDRDRRPGKPGNGDHDCEKQWRDARAYCSELAAMPRNSPEWQKYINIWGANYNRCVRGQVTERCGGNLIE